MEEKNTTASLGHEDYSRICHEVIDLLSKRGCTYWDAKEVFRYASGALLSQKTRPYSSASV